jgi:glucose-6-phosphate isomerase|tara:strand:- start:1831 stop:2988 length:1158 start_codon:yes stop_codon:yes gene_type:complete
MLTKNINFKNFKLKSKNKSLLKNLKILLKENNQIIKSLSPSYKNNYNKKTILKYKKFYDIRIIGMGGSTLGTESIYDFLKHKIKKKLTFYDNLTPNLKTLSKKKNLNLIVSKSGNTIETITNVNLILKKNNDKSIFITENKKSYLLSLAQKLKAEIIHHNNFIGGRYSVLSEVGMLPAELMGLKQKDFKQLNNLIKDRKFINLLVSNVSNLTFLLKKKKFNSIILNYDEKALSFFKWYQQLMAESLGKKGSGFMPIISTMPKDNHSLMQLYLDGPKNNFFTFFSVKEPNSSKIKSNEILSSHEYLKNKNIYEIITSQKLATENVFKKKNIPFRSFEILNRSEKSLGELFCFFILEIILLGKSLKVNPYDQPSVELIKKETKIILS